MRISSGAIYDANVAALGQQQTSLLKTQQQVATGRRIQTASDDPVAAARAISVNQADAMNTQYGANRTALRHTLSLAESNLQSVTSLLQDVQVAAVNAGNGALSTIDRHTMATELSGKLQELIGLANSTDGVGNYLFSGFQSHTPPFADVSGTITYNGDDGQRLMQANASRQIASSDSGADVFMRVKNGNGTFVAQPGVRVAAPVGANIGTGIISPGIVTDPAALVTGNSYTISFSVSAVTGATSYTVTGAPTALAPAMAGVAYVSGQAISFKGIQFDIQGAPADGDIFTVTPSTNESIFKTVSDLIAALNDPVPTAANGGTTGLTNSLSRGLKNLDNALNNVLSIRSSLGLRLQEVDALQTAGDDLSLQFKETLSQLQDVDPYKAYSDLAQQNATLQASLKSFAAVSSLSLFTYI